MREARKGNFYFQVEFPEWFEPYSIGELLKSGEDYFVFDYCVELEIDIDYVGMDKLKERYLDKHIRLEPYVNYNYGDECASIRILELKKVRVPTNIVKEEYKKYKDLETEVVRKRDEEDFERLSKKLGKKVE